MVRVLAGRVKSHEELWNDREPLWVRSRARATHAGGGPGSLLRLRVFSRVYVRVLVLRVLAHVVRADIAQTGAFARTLNGLLFVAVVSMMLEK